MEQIMVAMCYTNYLGVFSSPKSFCKKGEPFKDFAQKTVK